MNTSRNTRIINAQSRGPSIIGGVRELFRYRELLAAWAIRDIRVRYKQTMLGAAWAILQPLSLMVVFSVVFTLFVRVPTEGIPYPIFSYTALLPWTFFANAISFGVPTLVGNMNLVTKIYFPREILPLAAVAASFVDFCIAAIVFIGMMIYYQIPLGWPLLLTPIVMLVQILLTVAVVLYAAAVNVFYRDVRFIIPLVVQLWMYASPIIYPLNLVPERFRVLYMLNPMAGIIEAYRALVLRSTLPDGGALGSAAAISIVSCLLAYRWFKRKEREFADII